MATGIVNAGGSFGQFVFAPIAQGITAAAGWAGRDADAGGADRCWRCRRRGCCAATRRKRQRAAAPPAQRRSSARAQAIRRALRDPSYLLLRRRLLRLRLPRRLPRDPPAGRGRRLRAAAVRSARWSLAMIGLFNIVGSFAMGWAVGRWRMKSLLSLIYAARAVAVLVFLLAPKTEPVVLIFAAVIGAHLSCRPCRRPRAWSPSSSARRNMATLFGLVMLSHQVGGFLGAWLGGKAFEGPAATTGCGTPTSCWPSARRWSTCRSARRGCRLASPPFLPERHGAAGSGGTV